MARAGLTGSRIRERRSVLGLRQADLARQAGISASYLNLIEHNRRRIGGKILRDIAGVLGVDPAQLSEGAGAALTATLREAAADRPDAGAEADAAEEFAGRFPGWARLLAEQHRQIGRLEQSVEALTDRLAHDPHLAASLHEVLSTVTAIRSAATILVETRELEPEWRARFHRNIHEDSARLADGAQRLVDELDAGQTQSAAPVAPQDEVDAFLAASDGHVAAIEAGRDPEAALEGASFGSSAARDMARRMLARMAQDVAALPMDRLAAALRDQAGPVPDPSALAAGFGVPTGLVMRRLVSLPPDLRKTLLPAPPGLVIADASGTLLFRREITGFPVPRYGAACPLWPLFSAFSRPGVPIRQGLRMAGRGEGRFTVFAIAEADQPLRAGEEPVWRSHMLIWPDAEVADTAARVGVSCRICPREFCKSRRGPSIMARGA